MKKNDFIDELLNINDEQEIYSIDDSEIKEESTHFMDNRMSEIVANKNEEEATPFIFTLINDSDINISNLEIFNPIKIQTRTLLTDQSGNVTISYDLGYSYEEFVRSILAGLTSKVSKIEVISQNKQLLLSPITIEQYTMLNESYRKLIVPTYNSFQNMNDQVEKIVKFYLTKETSIKISILPPKSSATYRLYPTVVSSQIANIQPNPKPILYRRPSLSGMPLLAKATNTSKI